MNQKKVAIVGSRNLTDYQFFKESINTLFKINNFKTIISGGAVGTDSLARQYSIENNIELIEYKPDWGTYGKRAGYIRNETIINECDFALIFWDGESKGTLHDIRLCYKKGRSYLLIFV